MLRSALFAMSFFATPIAKAEGIVEDAFGIVPQAGLSASRTAWSGLRTVSGQRETVAPKSARTVLIFAGAKSLVAGQDIGHAVALVLDAQGNLAADGLAVDFAIGDAAQRGEPLANGIADVLFTPPTKAGTYAAGAGTGPVQSARALFRVTTDLRSVKPAIAPPGAPLVPETYSGFTTTPLRDRFGNEVEDGVTLGYVIAHADGSASQMPGLTRDGSAESQFLTRDVGTGGQISASLAGSIAPEVPVHVNQLAAAAPAAITAWPVPALDAIVVRVGPVTMASGYMLTDGAPVSIEVETAGGDRESLSGWIRDGHFDALLPLSPGAGPFTVTVETPVARETHVTALSEPPMSVRGVE